MRILVVNDDGIEAEGIRRLAKLASRLGEVWVVAPAEQCSAMSQRITVRGDLPVKPVSFPVEDVKAYSVGGTPADCVKVAIMHVMPERPDIVFSGINCGYNAGIDLLYSGTVGAAMEALTQGIPAIAFSSEMNGIYDVVEEYLLPLTQELLREPIAANEIWNLNFPGCRVSECRGVLRDRIPAQTEFYRDHYIKTEQPGGAFTLTAAGIPITNGAEGTDIRAVLEGYISIGKVQNTVVQADNRTK
jgi:5'-nucleotidase